MSHKDLILRTCDKNMCSFVNSNFKWPESGLVEASDWDPVPCCGNGLHGLLWGAGDGVLLSIYSDAIWIVAEVNTNEIVELNGKVKFPRAWVVHSGNQESATQFIWNNGARERKKQVCGLIIDNDKPFQSIYAGYNSKIRVGDNAIVFAGENLEIVTGNFSDVRTLSHADVKTGSNSRVSIGSVGGQVVAGDNCVIWAGWSARVVCGKNCYVRVDPYTMVTGMEGTTIHFYDPLCCDETIVLGKDGYSPDLSYRLSSLGEIESFNLEPNTVTAQEENNV